MEIDFFTEGKIKGRNEDYFEYNDNCFAITDGSTDHSGIKYDNKTGGELVSRLVVKESLTSSLNGVELINFLNDKIRKLYEKYNIESGIFDARYRFTCGCIVVRIVGEKVTITYVGDLGFRINGKDVYREIKQVDVDNTNARVGYIKQTGDIEGATNYIMPLIFKQYGYQNNPKHPLGYGVIDGTQTPSKFIKTFEYNLKDINSIELFTDGYFDVPAGTSIQDWENMHKQIELEDPGKYKKYKSTSSKDDRTVSIIKF